MMDFGGLVVIEIVTRTQVLKEGAMGGGRFIS